MAVAAAVVVAGVVVAVGVELCGIGIGIVLATLADRELEPVLEFGMEPELEEELEPVLESGTEPELEDELEPGMEFEEEPEVELEPELQFWMGLEVEVEVDLEAVSVRFLMSGASSPLSGERRWSKDCTVGAYVTLAVGELSLVLGGGYLMVEGTKEDWEPERGREW